MALPTTATCTYSVQAKGAVSNPKMVNAVSGIDLTDIDAALLVLYGITLASDTTAVSMGKVVRTIVYQLNAAGSTFFSTFITPTTWAAGTVYPLGAQVQPVSPNGYFYAATLPRTTKQTAGPLPFTQWQPSTVYPKGSIVGPTPPNSLYYTATASTGAMKSGTTEPAFPPDVGNTVVDHNVTWTCAGSTTSPVIGISGSVEPFWPVPLPGLETPRIVDNAGPSGIEWVLVNAIPDFAAPFYELHTAAIRIRGCVQVTAIAPVIA
jgi:hypothetical protein